MNACLHGTSKPAIDLRTMDSIEYYAWLDEQQATLRRLTGAIGIRGRA